MIRPRSDIGRNKPRLGSAAAAAADAAVRPRILAALAAEGPIPRKGLFRALGGRDKSRIGRVLDALVADGQVVLSYGTCRWPRPDGWMAWHSRVRLYSLPTTDTPKEQHRVVSQPQADRANRDR